MTAAPVPAPTQGWVPPVCDTIRHLSDVPAVAIIETPDGACTRVCGTCLSPVARGLLGQHGAVTLHNVYRKD